MYSATDARPIPQRVLIVRLGAMGDVLHAMPAVRTIRANIPHCEIGWVVEERWAELLCASGTPRTGTVSEGRPLVERVHTVDTKVWRKSALSPETWHKVYVAMREIRRCGYEVAVDFQGAAKSALLAALSGADSIEGFAHPREYVAKMLYSHTHPATGAHVVEQNLSLAAALAGSPATETTPLLPRDAEAEEWAQQQIGEGGRFAILTPGAGWGAKQWPTERYGEVARELAAEGIEPLINFGPGEEDMARETVLAAGGKARPLGATLAQLIAVTRRASLFIGGDTGPMHLASVLRVPVVALFGPTNPARNGPYATRARVLRSALSTTSYSHAKKIDEGLLSITPKEVMDAAHELLKD